MTVASRFTPAEWALLGDAPLAACAAVALAEPGGGAREEAALLRGWAEAGDLFAQSELLGAILRDLDPQVREAREQGRPNKADDSAAEFDDVMDEALLLCERAVGVLDRVVGPAGADEYRRFVLHLVRRVATATSEGGLFGLGGERVSRSERAVMREIEDALCYRA